MRVQRIEPPRRGGIAVPATFSGIVLLGLAIGFCAGRVAAAPPPGFTEPVHREVFDPRDMEPMAPPALGSFWDVPPGWPLPVPDPIPNGDGPHGDDSIARDPLTCETMELRVIHADQTATDRPEDISIRECWERHWLPYRRYEVSAGRLRDYRTAIAHWERFVAERASTTRTRAPNPPGGGVVLDQISAIDVATLNDFGVWLLAGGGAVGQSGEPEKMSQANVDKIAKSMHAILRAVGPRGKRNAFAPVLLDTVPLMTSARRLDGGRKQSTASGKNLSDRDLDRLYEACAVATWPVDHAVLQWRTFLVVGALLAPRPGDATAITAEAFSLRPEAPVDGSAYRSQCGWVRWESAKTGKVQVVPLPPVVSGHVAALLRKRGGELYSWHSYRQRPFERAWRAIVDQAGLPSVKRKDLRTTANNRWNAVKDGLGDWLLGHSARGVNDKHYRDRIPDAIDAAVKVAVPKSFTADQSDGQVQPFLF
ncbi:MAG: hypothetical protein AAF958_12940 [Planctomycetota bacterium]